MLSDSISNEFSIIYHLTMWSKTWIKSQKSVGNELTMSSMQSAQSGLEPVFEEKSVEFNFKQPI